MRGELDFASSLRKRVALLKGLPETALQRVVDERLQFNPGAQAWIHACKNNNIKTMVVSGGFTFFAQYVKNTLGLIARFPTRWKLWMGNLPAISSVILWMRSAKRMS